MYVYVYVYVCHVLCRCRCRWCHLYDDNLIFILNCTVSSWLRQSEANVSPCPILHLRPQGGLATTQGSWRGGCDLPMTFHKWRVKWMVCDGWRACLLFPETIRFNESSFFRPFPMYYVYDWRWYLGVWGPSRPQFLDAWNCEETKSGWSAESLSRSAPGIDRLAQKHLIQAGRVHHSVKETICLREAKSFAGIRDLTHFDLTFPFHVDDSPHCHCSFRGSPLSTGGFRYHAQAKPRTQGHSRTEYWAGHLSVWAQNEISRGPATQACWRAAGGAIQITWWIIELNWINMLATVGYAKI